MDDLPLGSEQRLVVELTRRLQTLAYESLIRQRPSTPKVPSGANALVRMYVRMLQCSVSSLTPAWQQWLDQYYQQPLDLEEVL